MYARVKRHLTETEMSDSLRFSFRVVFSELEHLRQLKKELLLQLKRLAKSDRYREGVELLRSAWDILPSRGTAE